MKTRLQFLFLLLAVAISLPRNTLLAATPAELVSLQADNFEHIQFKRIKASDYRFYDDQLRISVDDST